MSLHKELERRVAQFVGKEDAVVFAMGYATNSTSLPALAGPVRCPVHYRGTPMVSVNEERKKEIKRTLTARTHAFALTTIRED